VPGRFRGAHAAGAGNSRFAGGAGWDPASLITGPMAPPRAAMGGGQECDPVRVTHRRLSSRPIAWGMGHWQYHGS
jgi:hypothetical protein